MQSLRTRRSQAPPARKVQRAGTKLAKGPSLRNDTRKSRVDDRIKKRMSMRYADISGPVDVPPMPPMPTMALGGVQEEEAVYDERSRREDPAVTTEDDKKLLDKDDFDPDAYLRMKMANSTEAEVKSLQSSLRGAKEDTATDLQKNVFKNYAEFVLISKEISTLENEMLELKESLSEYKSMPSLLHIPDPTSASSSNISAYRRSSVADLRVMYYNQMQALHAQIEGSAKFAPITPGRHVVGEVDGVLSLNAATYKVMGRVKFVVLDDAVLVAKRRRRNGEASASRSGSTTEGKLVADRCWPLSEMLVLDTKDSPSMTNVFKIRHGKETHVYRTETPSDKKSLLSQLRHVAEELAAKKRKEREGEHERRKSMWQGGAATAMDRMSTYNAEWMTDLAKKAGEIPGTSAKEKSETRRTLLEEVSVTMLIGLLLRLGAAPAAKTTFLKMRSQVIKNLVRKIRFEGHIGAYIGDLAIVTFTAIKHTADWFLASFKENEAASTFIEWAKLQMENYADTFRKQVYSSDVDEKVIEEAMKITYSQSRKLLEDFGLDFRFLLDDVLLATKLSSPTMTSYRGRSPTPSSASASSNATVTQSALPSAALSSASVYSPTPSSEAPPPVPPLLRARTPTTTRVALASPTPRRTRTPPPSASPLRPGTAGSVKERERPPRSTKASPGPPPRSTNRPGSSVSHRPPPVAVPNRDGMF
ncbi:hypothetical protein BDZ89DRAFT_1092282 [Hymenopellis radicata]|nr:hypothetical protein BDZ89DRAFT_1092282 [Hymenopellis radicata]